MSLDMLADMLIHWVSLQTRVNSMDPTEVMEGITSILENAFSMGFLEHPNALWIELDLHASDYEP